MTDRITKLQRWLDLIGYLAARKFPVAVEDLMEHVPAYAEKWRTGEKTAQESARRAFERDKDELKALGIPLDAVEYSIQYGTERAEGYRLAKRDFYLPYLRLVAELSGGGRGVPDAGKVQEVEVLDADAQIALDALRRVAEVPSFPLAREARSAFRKLAFDLDPDRFAAAPVLYVDRPGADELLGTLRLLSGALLARKRVTFRYRGIQRGTATDRDVAPYGLLFQGGHWYLVGHDATRAAVRVFRVGRMESVAANAAKPRTPDYDVPADFRLEAYRDREAWELGGEGDEAPLRAEVLFHFPLSLWAERNRHGTAVEARDDGGVVRAFEVSQPNPFLRWLLGLGGDAELLGPAALREELRAMAREVAALYGGEGVHG